MNFLAHALLSCHGSDDFLYGNLIADGVKGINLEAWPAAVASGIRHHRQVDAAIDRHAEVLRLLQSAPRAQRRYTGIALDLIWDHFLASHYPDPALVDRCYQVLGERDARAQPARSTDALAARRVRQSRNGFRSAMA